jgi:hypothetical protein
MSAFKFISVSLWLLCISALGDWKADQFFYLFNGSTPGVALNTNTIFCIDHAVTGTTSVQIGDQNGLLPSYCTTFINCPTSIQNCQWLYNHVNVTNDRLLFITCRPLTNGITRIATNVTVGTPVTWFSNVTRAWIDGAITFITDESPVTFPDNSIATIGMFIFDGPQAVSGDSGSPVFVSSSGDFVGSVSALAGGGTTVGKWAYPHGWNTPHVSATTFFLTDPDL